jgi:hypothetical protein
MLRRSLRAQIGRVMAGEDPVGVIFDPQVIHVEGGNLFTDPPIAVR